MIMIKKKPLKIKNPLRKIKKIVNKKNRKSNKKNQRANLTINMNNIKFYYKIKKLDLKNHKLSYKTPLPHQLLKRVSRQSLNPNRHYWI